MVYGGIGRAARDWDSFDRIVAALRRLEEDETLLVQSGKPVGVFRTHADAPRVLIANSNLVPHWATWDHFHELDRKGLMMYGQMTAGSWIYIGAQGIVQGTYETFVEAGRQHYNGDLSGRWILTAGLGGMGGAQPLAAVMAGASCLAVECQPSRIEMRLRTGYLDRTAADLDEALAIIDASCRDRKPVSVGLLGNAAEILPELLARGVRPDILTDQTSAHDPVNGYLPAGWTVAEWETRRERDPKAVEQAATRSMAAHVEAMLRFHRMGVPTVDYGNNIRQRAKDAGVADAFDFPGFVPAYIRPLFCRGVGPFRWVALSGDPEDIFRTDQRVKELLPDDRHLHNWLDMARQRIHFQGLPARICWVGLGDRHRLGLAFNEMVARGEVKAPIVIGRDHLDSGSVASPNRETEAMLDGSDAVSDWPLLNALLNCALLGLQRPHPRIEAVAGQQVRQALPRSATTPSANTRISSASTTVVRQAVGDHQCRPMPVRHRAQRRLDVLLGFGCRARWWPHPISGCAGLSGWSARCATRCFSPPESFQAALADPGVVAVRQAEDEIMVIACASFWRPARFRPGTRRGGRSRYCSGWCR